MLIYTIKTVESRVVVQVKLVESILQAQYEYNIDIYAIEILAHMTGI